MLVGWKIRENVEFRVPLNYLIVMTLYNVHISTTRAKILKSFCSPSLNVKGTNDFFLDRAHLN